MKRVEEYLSIIDDPDIAPKLVVLLEELSGGSTLDQAAARASLERRKVEILLSSLKEFISRRAGSGSGGSVEHSPTGKVVAYCDGASRGNPGEAACAALIYDDSGQEIIRKAKRIGKATNNVAEYRGVILALELAISKGARKVELRLDSELVVKQLRGEFKVKNLKLRDLNEEVLCLLRRFSSFSVEFIPREKNLYADAMANAALDGEI